MTRVLDGHSHCHLSASWVQGLVPGTPLVPAAPAPLGWPRKACDQGPGLPTLGLAFASPRRCARPSLGARCLGVPSTQGRES